METIAVYREERVKVYGITEKSDLALAILHFPAAATERWGQHIVNLEDAVSRFDLVTCHGSTDVTIEMHLLFDSKYRGKLQRALDKVIGREQHAGYNLHHPVEALFLFGPHFQDRYGIADIGFSALYQGGVKILVSGCAGTSMYFVTPQHEGAKALTVLNDTFLIPLTIAPP